MSKTFNYTDYFTSPGSDVIDSVYYNSNSYELYVVTNRDDSYGYSGVPGYLFNHFREALSKGHFWNEAVKNRYRNISRAEDVDFVSATAAKPSYTSTVTTLAASQPDAEYTVTFEVSGTLRITGTANGYDDAVAKATKIVNEQLVGNFTVKDVKKN